MALGAVSLPLLAGAAIFLALPPAQDTPTVLDLTDVAARAAPTAPALPAGPENVEVTVQRNDTLDRIFRSVGIDNATLAELRAVPDVRKALDILRPGDIITLTHADGVLQTLNRRISDTLTLSVSRAADGFAVNFIENPLELEVTGARASKPRCSTRGAPPACRRPPSWSSRTKCSAGTSTSRTTSAKAMSSACSTSASSRTART